MGNNYNNIVSPYIITVVFEGGTCPLMRRCTQIHLKRPVHCRKWRICLLTRILLAYVTWDVCSLLWWISSLDHIVLDELHLLLRIMDVFIRNLILYADSEDHRQKAHHGVESHNVRKLEQAIRSCGVCFQIWQNKEPTGKPIPGSFDWTALSGRCQHGVHTQWVTN